MTSSKLDQGSHVDEGDLIRLMDEECSPSEANRLRAHIDGCPECGSALESLEQMSGLFSSAVEELDAESMPTRDPVPAVGKGLLKGETRLRFASSRILRIAAVLAAVILVSTASPARALFARGWEALRSLVVSEPAELPAPATAGSESEPAIGSVIRFTPRGSEFLLEFTERPAGGTLILVVDSSTSASASVVGDEPGDEMVLLPTGLRIRNSHTSLASYEVRLPLSLVAVEVRIAGVLAMRIDVGALEEPLRRELNLTEQPLTLSR